MLSIDHQKDYRTVQVNKVNKKTALNPTKKPLNLSKK